jgi:Domain of unknown function (DUF4249)
MTQKIGYLLILICCISCEKVLNVTLPYEGNKFVIFGELSPQNVVSVQVERTFPPTGEVTFNNDYLSTTKVTLIEDNKEIEILKRIGISTIFSSEGLYKPKLGKAYKVRVEAAGFITAESKPNIIPAPIEINNVAFAGKEVVSPLNQQIPTKLLNIDFGKIPEDATYFLAEIVALYKNTETSAIVISDLTIPEFGSPCVYDYTSRKKIYNSDCFNKKENRINFFVELEVYVEVSPNKYMQKQIDKVSINLSSTNKFYLDFYSNLNPTEGLFKAFQTSRPTVTNINNGYGAILTKNSVTVNLKL